MEEFNFLQNFSSLLEVFTAIYVSMFIDEILSNFWIPDYQDKISKLIEGMKIPAINYFVVKVKTNIGKNAEEIGGHIKGRQRSFSLTAYPFTACRIGGSFACDEKSWVCPG